MPYIAWFAVGLSTAGHRSFRCFFQLVLLAFCSPHVKPLVFGLDTWWHFYHCNDSSDRSHDYLHNFRVAQQTIRQWTQHSLEMTTCHHVLGCLFYDVFLLLTFLLLGFKIGTWHSFLGLSFYHDAHLGNAYEGLLHSSLLHTCQLSQIIKKNLWIRIFCLIVGMFHEVLRNVNSDCKEISLVDIRLYPWKTFHDKRAPEGFLLGASLFRDVTEADEIGNSRVVEKVIVI